ncbi:hypothetical protein KQI61_16785, partial [Anaerocolumna aminovalerica]|uniref:hypothetical protein n=1 Tax=Anaerocolumna aminovalerica TaxID=1527 RepID=UPI001C0EBD52
ENEEAYLACPKTGIIDTNIKMVLNTVMEQDSENPTPKLDKEPIIYENIYLWILHRRYRWY